MGGGSCGSWGVWVYLLAHTPWLWPLLVRPQNQLLTVTNLVLRLTGSGPLLVEQGATSNLIKILCCCSNSALFNLTSARCNTRMRAQVQVMKLDHLPKMDGWIAGGRCDPYVVLGIHNVRDAEHTHTHTHTHTPQTRTDRLMDHRVPAQHTRTRRPRPSPKALLIHMQSLRGRASRREPRRTAWRRSTAMKFLCFKTRKMTAAPVII